MIKLKWFLPSGSVNRRLYVKMEMTPICSMENINNEQITCGSTVSEDVLTPGESIRPDASIEDVTRLAECLYGITVGEVKELKAYDDKNFHIFEDRNIKNPLISNRWPHGYIFKIINSHDSQKLGFIEAQTKLLLYLREKNFVCPNPVKNVYGNYYSIETLKNRKHVIRLLEFIPGKIFHEVQPSNILLFQAGEYIANLNNVMKNFNHDGYKNHKTLWMLQSVPKLKDFIYVIKDNNRQEIVKNIIAAFSDQVLSQLEFLESSIIHGDFNEQNILVSNKENNEENQIIGVLDFGDTSYSPVVFDLAIAMTYMIIETKTIASGGIVLAGYLSVRKLKDNEREILKICVAARLCQSLILGAYTHSIDPGNDYLLTTQKTGWEILELFSQLYYDKIDELWEKTAEEYMNNLTE